MNVMFGTFNNLSVDSERLRCLERLDSLRAAYFNFPAADKKHFNFRPRTSTPTIQNSAPSTASSQLKKQSMLGSSAVSEANKLLKGAQKDTVNDRVSSLRHYRLRNVGSLEKIVDPTLKTQFVAKPT